MRVYQFKKKILNVCLYQPTSLNEQDATQGKFLAECNGFEVRVFFLLDWLPNQDWKKKKKKNLPYYLPIAGGRIGGFISFPRI